LAGLAIATAPVLSSAKTVIYYTYDALGRIVTVSHGAATTTYTYDRAGNRTQLVVGAPQAPVANPVAATVVVNSTNNNIPLDISGGPATSVTVSTAPSHGTASASGITIRYTPNTGYAGLDAFNYTATNSVGTSPPATASLTVFAPVTHTYTSGTNVTETVPTNAHQVVITADGGGGGGVCMAGGGGAGGGSGEASKTIAVTGGDTLLYTVGVAGTGTVGCAGSATGGGATTVSGAVTGGSVNMSAHGGAAAQSTTGGTGGTATGGATNIAGSPGGDGGQSVGTIGGNAASGAAGGGEAGNGAAPGAGGGGGVNTIDHKGGNGGAGQVQFAYS
jgi:hypothetical protein